MNTLDLERKAQEAQTRRNFEALKERLKERGKLNIKEAKIRASKIKNFRKIIQKIQRGSDKIYNKRVVFRRILRPSERVGVVIQVAEKKPTKIKNFIDSSLISGRSL